MIIPSRNRLLYNETLNYVYEILPITYIIEIVVYMIPPWAIVSNVYYFFVRNCRTHGHVSRFVSLWEISSSFIDSCMSQNFIFGPIKAKHLQRCFGHFDSCPVSTLLKNYHACKSTLVIASCKTNCVRGYFGTIITL